jgi:hypothetical protein
VNEAVAWLVAGCGLVVAARACWLVAGARRVDNAQFYLVAAAELVLVIVAVGGLVALARTSRDVDGFVFGSYLVTTAAILPVALLWGVSDETRWGPGSLLVGGLVVAVLALRLLQLWVGVGG